MVELTSGRESTAVLPGKHEVRGGHKVLWGPRRTLVLPGRKSKGSKTKRYLGRSGKGGQSL